MNYTMIRPLKVYKSQDSLILPKGTKTGFNNVLFALAPTKADADQSFMEPFLNYQVSMYKNYLVDFIYNEKIGIKHYVKNNTGIFKKDFPAISFKCGMHQIFAGNKKAALKTKPNVLVNLGEWANAYYQYSIKNVTLKICENFIAFLSKRINEDFFSEYDKIIYIDAWQWFGKQNKKFGLSRNDLNNPISILLLTLYRYPEYFRTLGMCTFMIVDSKNGEFIQIPVADCKKENYSRIKSLVLTLTGIAEIADTDSINDGENKTDTELTPSETIAKDISTQMVSKKDAMKAQIISKLKKNIIGDTPDIASKFDDTDDEERPTIIKTTNPNDAEIEDIANTFIDENVDLFEEDPEEGYRKVEEIVKRKVYISPFTPTRSAETLKRIKELTELQADVIGLPSFQDLDSKVIEEIDFSDYVNTNNANIIKSKFANFDHSYNTKKMTKDIDEAVGIMSQADSKVFITDKTEVDTSDQLDFKKTITYNLQDENGTKMTLKMDIPLIIDDKYVFLNGSKKVLPHQLILKPIVKTKKDTVQLVTCLNKVFIVRQGKDDIRTAALYKYITTNPDIVSVPGNGIVLDKELITTLEFDIIGKKLYSFIIGDMYFSSDVNHILELMDKEGIKYKAVDQKINLIIGYDKKLKRPIFIDKIHDSYTEKILSYLPTDIQTQILGSIKGKRNKQLVYCKCKIMGSYAPVILFVLYCEGLISVMQKAGIEYKFVPVDQIDNINPSEWGITELEDGYLVWKRYPMENSLLMNGLSIIPTELYTYEEMNSRDTYIYMLSQFYDSLNMSYNLDQFKDFLIDNVTREILMDYHLPTDVVSIFLYAIKLLSDNDYKIETDYSNMRVRSNELISAYVYTEVTAAYRKYRKSKAKKHPTKISLKGNEIMAAIKGDQITEDDSVLNPILQLSKTSSVTYKGLRGIGMDEAMTLPKRAYNSSMVGIVGITTSPDSGVGVNRNLTFEPNISSTRGYLDITDRADINNLHSANLLTAAEMLTPLGVQHDDPARTAMSYKQSMYMLMTDDSDPVMIGNGVEKIIPYRMSDEFTTIASDNGKVIDIQDNFVVIKYNNGRFQTIDTSRRVKRNSASGFYIINQLTCEKKKGDTVKKGEVVAWNDKAFKKNKDDLSASMRLGTLVKIAVVPEWDIYEDSAPISAQASKKMTTDMSMDTEVTLNKTTHVYSMAKIGDQIRSGDSLIKFDQGADDAGTQEYFDNLRKTLSKDELDDMIESNSTTKKSKYTGTIVDIQIFATVDLDELSPTLKEIVSEYYDRIDTKEKLLTKYSNPDDTNYYKSGQLITEASVKIKTDYSGKARGAIIGEGVLIVFHIEYKATMARGDKLAAEFALKSINSHVIEEGLEPFSEFNPNEIIDLISAPLSISARKTPSIFPAMFGNKEMIEAKRHLKDYWNNN